MIENFEIFFWKKIKFLEKNREIIYEKEKIFFLYNDWIKKLTYISFGMKNDIKYWL
jgi:hypothetical protein